MYARGYFVLLVATSCCTMVASGSVELAEESQIELVCARQYRRRNALHASIFGGAGKEAFVSARRAGSAWLRLFKVQAGTLYRARLVRDSRRYGTTPEARL